MYSDKILNVYTNEIHLRGFWTTNIRLFSNFTKKLNLNTVKSPKSYQKVDNNARILIAAKALHKLPHTLTTILASEG